MDVYYEVLAQRDPYVRERPCMVVRVFDTEAEALAYVNSLEFSRFGMVSDPHDHVRVVYAP